MSERELSEENAPADIKSLADGVVNTREKAQVTALLSDASHTTHDSSSDNSSASALESELSSTHSDSEFTNTSSTADSDSVPSASATDSLASKDDRGMTSNSESLPHTHSHSSLPNSHDSTEEAASTESAEEAASQPSKPEKMPTLEEQKADASENPTKSIFQTGVKRVQRTSAFLAPRPLSEVTDAPAPAPSRGGMLGAMFYHDGEEWLPYGAGDVYLTDGRLIYVRRALGMLLMNVPLAELEIRRNGTQIYFRAARAPGQPIREHRIDFADAASAQHVAGENQ